MWQNFLNYLCRSVNTIIFKFEFDDVITSTMASNLTGIRGIAALWVFGFHFNEYFVGFVPEISRINFILANGRFGVDLFFCLSGFILGHVYFNELSFENNGIKIKHFLYKRFARLSPVYFVTLAAATMFYLIAVWTGHEFNNASSEDISLEAFAYNLLGVQTWLGMNSLNVPAWSVSGEFAAYLVFPLLVIFLRRRDNEWKSFSLPILLLSICIYEFFLQREMLRNHVMVRVLTEFIMGLCAYLIVKNLYISERRCKFFRKFLTLAILLILYFIQSEIILSAIIPILFLSLIALNFFYNIPGKGLSRRILLTLGFWSYSLYMTHFLFIQIMSGLDLPYYDANFVLRSLQISLLLIVPIFTAFMTTKYLENPARRYLLKLWT